MDNRYIQFLKIILIIINMPFLMGYGYDSATSCSPKLNRHGRAQLLSTIPCDLTQQAYCNLPGSAYPWHAVRRFVHENQGLMKRMYGDVRHISILRSEIQNNDIEVDDIEVAAARYSGDGYRKEKYLHSEMENIKSNDVLPDPQFKPTTTTSAETTTTTTEKPTTTTTSTTTSTPTTANPTIGTTTTKPQKEISLDNEGSVAEAFAGESPDHNLESNSIADASTTEPNLGSIKLVHPPNLSQNKTESATISTTLRVVQQIIKSEIEAETTSTRQQDPEAEIIQQANDRMDYNVAGGQDDIRGTIKVYKEDDPKPVVQEFNKIKEGFFEKKKINRPSTMEGQLFQDTIQKETPPLNARGVNACPVKEEVVAPFWANNTRGEVLALLNLYPFEQYVHWEKCTHEHKQMYCREGCRCEQQYRLHRLLAYDPHNECRGIFSDWFRFPSCCICKCYDIPFDFRVTSRSPRTSLNDNEDNKLDTKNPIDVAEDFVKQAIYEHATEDWYRPHNEFDSLD